METSSRSDGCHDGIHVNPEDRRVEGGLLDTVSARDRRTLAIRFLRSEETIPELLRRCRGSTAEALESRLTLASVLLMVENDAPRDLVFTDSGLYGTLRKKITDIRLGAWV